MNTHGIVLVADTTADLTCAYDPACQCHKQARHQFYYAHVGQTGDYTTLSLTRDGVVDVMFDLFNNPTVDRMWIQNTPDRASFLWWCPVPVASRIGDWAVDFEGNTYCFSWSDQTETIHCGTLGEWFGPMDCFGQRRWASHRAAVVWTLDNIDRIAERQHA